MTCPNCKKEIESVNVYAQSVQSATVDVNGKITAYGVATPCEDIQCIECEDCGEDLSNEIAE